MFSAVLASSRTGGLLQTAAETVDTPREPLFVTNEASDSFLRCFEVNGQLPSRKTWNFDLAKDRLFLDSKERIDNEDDKLRGIKKCTFSLKALEHRDWRLARSDLKKRTKGLDPLAPEPPPISEARASLKVSQSMPTFQSSLENEKERPLKRADKYYQALLKAERARSELVRRDDWEDFCTKAERAAENAKKKAVRAEARAARLAAGDDGSSSESEDEEDEEEDEEDCYEDPGPLQPYPGLMKVEVDVVVLRAPGEEKSDTESEGDDKSTHTPSTASVKDEDDEEAIDWDKELQDLVEELGEPEKEKAESDTDSIPDGLGGQKIGNVHDAYNKRTALGLGGTAFFVPEVERYAMAPSLLPPPPRGLGYLAQIGRKRLKMKPRLPLEVSKHRWRDEHPYGCPAEDEYSPELDDFRTFEGAVRRVELYGTLSNLLTKMPKPDGIRKIPRSDDFEQSLDRDLKDSVAWKQYIKRQRLLESARFEREAKEASKAEAELEATQVKGKSAVAAAKAAAAAAGTQDAELDKTKKKGEHKTRRESAGFKESEKYDVRPKPSNRPSRTIPPHPGAPPLKMAGLVSGGGFQCGQVIGSNSSSMMSLKGKSSMSMSMSDAENQSRQESPPNSAAAGSPEPLS